MLLCATQLNTITEKLEEVGTSEEKTFSLKKETL